MAQMHQPTPPVPRAIAFPCPMCARTVHPGDIFCCFCGQPLRVQCPECGRWTQENHRVCPACGSALHRPGLSFAQKHRRETLQHTLDELDRSHTESARHLLAARRKQRHATYRLLTVGMLAGTLLLILKTTISAGLSFPGLLILLLALLLFWRLIPTLPGLGGHICRWSAPGDLAYWQEEQRSERTRLVELAQAYAATARALADLDVLTAACLPELDKEEEIVVPVSDPIRRPSESRRSRATQRAQARVTASSRTPTVARPPAPDEGGDTPAPAHTPQPSKSWHTRLLGFACTLARPRTSTVVRPPAPDEGGDTPAPAHTPQPLPRHHGNTAPEATRRRVSRSHGRRPSTDPAPRFFRGRSPSPASTAGGRAEEEEQIPL
jgi:ribosomal protein L32